MLIDLIKEWLKEEGYEPEPVLSGFVLLQSQILFLSENPEPQRGPMFAPLMTQVGAIQRANLVFHEDGDTLNVAKSRFGALGVALKAADPRFFDQVKHLINLHAQKCAEKRMPNNTNTLNNFTTTDYEILRGIKYGQALTEIASNLGVNYYTLRDRARKLANAGLIQRNGRGQRMTTSVDLRKFRGKARRSS